MTTFANIQTEIAAMLEVADEDLTPEQQSAMDQYLNDLAGQEADKVDAFAGFIREQAARAEQRETRVDADLAQLAHHARQRTHIDHVARQ